MSQALLFIHKASFFGKLKFLIMFSHGYLVSTEFLLEKQGDNVYFEPKYYAT